MKFKNFQKLDHSNIYVCTYYYFTIIFLSDAMWSIDNMQTFVKLLIFLMNLGLVFTIQNCPLEVKKESIQNVVPCSLRKTVVSLEIPENLKNKNIIKIIPDKALVNKCDGSCWMTQNTCKATLLKNTSLAVTGNILFILY